MGAATIAVLSQKDGTGKTTSARTTSRSPDELLARLKMPEARARLKVLGGGAPAE